MEKGEKVGNLLSKCIHCELDEAFVILAHSSFVKNFKSNIVMPLLPNLLLADFSYNKIKSCNIWGHFPKLWWINLSHNEISAKGLNGLPRVIGELKLDGNRVANESLELDKALDVLHDHYILRLKFSEDIPTREVVKRLPLVLVLNDQFIRHYDRGGIGLYGRISDGLDVIASTKTGNWSTIACPISGQNFLSALQSLPKDAHSGDTYLLDIVLEDYLEQARLVNRHILEKNHASSMNLSSKHIPTVDMDTVLSLPHAIRIDLATILCASLLFELAESVYKETLVYLLCNFWSMSAITDLIALPAFVKSGVVSCILRICKKELQEYRSLRKLSKKPRNSWQDMMLSNKNVWQKAFSLDIVRVGEAISNSSGRFHWPLLPTYFSSNGYFHLRSFKIYVDESYDDHFNSIPAPEGGENGFSEIELEILDCLPSIPTGMDRVKDNGERKVKYSDWISLVARHCILLMTKAPSCPSFVRAQSSKLRQENYMKMLPLIRAAKMTYSDMDICGFGPDKDGRELNAKSLRYRDHNEHPDLVTTRFGDLEYERYLALKASMNQTKMHRLSSSMGGNVLAFGRGIPHGNPDQLLWNTTKFDERMRGRHNDSPTLIDSNCEITSNLHLGSLSSGELKGRVPEGIIDDSFADDHAADSEDTLDVADKSEPGTYVNIPMVNELMQTASNSFVGTATLSLSETKHSADNFSDNKIVENVSVVSELASGGMNIPLLRPNVIEAFSNDEEPKSFFLLSSKENIVSHSSRPSSRAFNYERYQVSSIVENLLSSPKAHCEQLLSSSQSWEKLSEPPVLIDPVVSHSFREKTSQMIDQTQSLVWKASQSLNKYEAPPFVSLTKETIQDAAKSLFVEMGTYKNIKELSEYKRTHKNDCKKVKDKPKQTSSVSEMSVSKSLPNLEFSWKKCLRGFSTQGSKDDFEVIDSQLKTTDVYDLGNSMALYEEKQLDNQFIEERTFLTNTMSAEVDGKFEGSNNYLKETMSNLIVHKNASEILKGKLSYPKINIMGGVEPGSRSVAGIALKPSWYPLQQKVSYVLDSSAANRIVSETIRESAPITSKEAGSSLLMQEPSDAKASLCSTMESGAAVTDGKRPQIVTLAFPQKLSQPDPLESKIAIPTTASSNRMANKSMMSSGSLNEESFTFGSRTNESVSSFKASLSDESAAIGEFNKFVEIYDSMVLKPFPSGSISRVEKSSSIINMTSLVTSCVSNEESLQLSGAFGQYSTDLDKPLLPPLSTHKCAIKQQTPQIDKKESAYQLSKKIRSENHRKIEQSKRRRASTVSVPADTAKPSSELPSVVQLESSIASSLGVAKLTTFSGEPSIEVDIPGISPLLPEFTEQ